MQITVVGFDPSLTNWGIAEAILNLTTGVLGTPVLTTVSPEEITTKSVRTNSRDLHRAEQLATAALKAARAAKVIFVEVPVGSQSARAMASYGICLGVLAAIRAEGLPLIEVTPTEVKVAMTGNKNATKQQMIDAAMSEYPHAHFPTHNGKLSMSKAEHVADAIGAIHAGAATPMFQNLLRILKGE